LPDAVGATVALAAASVRGDCEMATIGCA